MEFKPENVYYALNVTEGLIGAKGYFADNLGKLKELVEKDSTYNYDTVYKFDDIGIMEEDSRMYRWQFFYLVEPADHSKKFRPFRNCDELIETYEKKTNLKFNHNLGLPQIWVQHKILSDRKRMLQFDGDSVVMTVTNETKSFPPLMVRVLCVHAQFPPLT